MNVEIVKNSNDDLMIANTARVSFANWNSELDLSLNTKGIPKDPALITYLAKHKHTSPFYHIRFTFLLEKTDIDFYSIQDPSLLMGAVWDSAYPNKMYFRHSFYGWVKLIKLGYIRNSAAIKEIISTLNYHAPYALNAYGLVSAYDDKADYSVQYYNPRFLDASVRFNVNIPIARQLFTHREFVSNEISRRYVSSKPTLHYPEELRSKPEGSIKQGSGDVHIHSEVLVQEGLDLFEDSIAFYNKLISNDVAPEQARFYVPQAMGTSFIFTGSLHSFSKLVINRTDSHAQLEIQKVAHQLDDVLRKTPYGMLYSNAYINSKQEWERPV